MCGVAGARVDDKPKQTGANADLQSQDVVPFICEFWSHDGAHGLCAGRLGYSGLLRNHLKRKELEDAPRWGVGRHGLFEPIA